MKTFLNEQWTDDELYDTNHIFSAVCEGVDCSLPIERMRQLEKRGLVKDIKAGPKRGCKAGRYEFMWTDKLDALVKAWRSELFIKNETNTRKVSGASPETTGASPVPPKQE